MVGAVGEAVVQAGVVEGLLEGAPLVGGEAAAADGAGLAVIVVVEVLVGLGLPEVGEDFFEGPLVVSGLGPEVEVLAFATQEVGAVDGAGAAGDPTSRHHGGDGLIGGAGLEVPEVMAFEDGGPGAVEILQLGG